MSHFKLIEKLVAESIVCRKNLIKKLRLIGGRHPRAMVYNILQRLLSDEVAEKFTYMGMRSNKYKFKDTVLCKIIRAAVTPDCTEEVLKSVIGDWLVQAKFRKIRKQMKDEKSLTEENGDRDFTF